MFREGTCSKWLRHAKSWRVLCASLAAQISTQCYLSRALAALSVFVISVPCSQLISPIHLVSSSNWLQHGSRSPHPPRPPPHISFPTRPLRKYEHRWHHSHPSLICSIISTSRRGSESATSCSVPGTRSDDPEHSATWYPTYMSSCTTL